MIGEELMKLLDSVFYSKYNTRALEMPASCRVNKVYINCPEEGTCKTVKLEKLLGKRPVEFALVGQKCFVAVVAVEKDGVVLRLRGFAESDGVEDGLCFVRVTVENEITLTPALDSSVTYRITCK